MSVVPDKNSQKDDSSSDLSYLKHDENKDEGDPEQAARKSGERERSKQAANKKVAPQPPPQPVRKEKQPQQEPLLDASTQGIFLYKPGVELPNLFPFIGQQIKIIIASEYITKHNPQYIKRSIYGSEPYTSNSDALCIGVHSEKIMLQSYNSRKYEGVELTCKITRPKRTYTSTLRNGLTSRSVKGYDGNAIKPEFVRQLTNLGPPELLEKYAANMHIPIGTKRVKAKPRNISSVIPIPETHIVFNMNNEPAYKYSLFNIADRGFEKSEWVIRRLEVSVLYLEGEDVKYELFKGKDPIKAVNEKEFFDVFRFSIVKNPERIDNEYMSKTFPPLNEDQLDIVYTDIEWEEILWGNNSIQIKDKVFGGLRSFKYYKKALKQ